MESPPPFCMGRVLRRAVSTLAGHLPGFLLLALLVFLPVFVVSLIVSSGAPVTAYTVGDAEIVQAAPSRLGGQFVVGMLAFIAQYVLAGVLTHGVFEVLASRPVTARDIVAKGIRRLLPVVDVAFVTGALVGAGYLLLVVPGLILTVVLFVAVPAAVVERPGVVAALRRSRELTRGHRPALLGIVVVTLGLMVLAGLFLPPLLEGLLGRVGALVVAAVAQALLGLFGGICQTVAYHDLLTRVAGAAPTSASPTSA